jgi:hypothetical protein
MKNTENLNILDNSHSPIIIRSNNVSNSSFKNTQSSNDMLNSFSPFAMKRDLPITNNFSNSNSHTKNCLGHNFHTGPKVYTPSPNVVKERLSDRFIPINKGNNLLEKFELANQWDNSNEIETETNEIGNNYSVLLQSNFFFGSTANTSETMKFKSKIFQFKSDHRKRSTINSLKISSMGKGDNISFNRKINTKPYKILDAPGLLDDFYLNLVDWSSKNDIAVGLSNTVYLWCANKTQIVNLVNYGGEKYVSSVMWNGK